MEIGIAKFLTLLLVGKSSLLPDKLNLSALWYIKYYEHTTYQGGNLVVLFGNN